MNSEKIQASGAEVVEQTPLQKFQAEIAEIRQKETEGKISTAHLKGTDNLPPVSSEELNEEDYLIWQRLNEITPKDFDVYLSGVVKSQNSSRIAYTAFLGNKLSIIWGRKAIDEMQRSGKETFDILKGFRAEIIELKIKEPTGDLERLDVADLEVNDRVMWDRVKAFEAGSAELPRREFDFYHREAIHSGVPSRMYFAAFLGNKLFVIYGQRGM